MDEAVDQVMGRSSDEKGADKSVALRRSQSKDRARLLQDIETEQKTISSLNEERAPIAAEVRKVEAEVGPLKYIAAFVYGSTDQNILEKAVTWVIITLIVVFDPLAVILLLASQMSFQEFRERENKIKTNTGLVIDKEGTIVGFNVPKKDVEEKPTAEEILQAGVTNSNPEDNVPVLEDDFKFLAEDKDLYPAESVPESVPEPINCNKCNTELVEVPNLGLHCPNLECGVIKETVEEPEVQESVYIQNEEQKESNLWSSQLITKEEYIKTTEESKPVIDPYNDSPPPEVQRNIDLIKAKKIKLSDLHPEMAAAVKKRM
jgi:hypothetical protein